METIKSYPFTGCNSEVIKRIGDRIGISYDYNGVFNVFFEDEVADKKIKSLLCYFKFLNQQIYRFNRMNKNTNGKIYSVDTYLDTILMNINEFVSLCKKKNLTLSPNEILMCLNQNDEIYNYRYLSCVIDLLMNDSYCVSVYSTDTCVKYDENLGDLNSYVSYILDNEYGLEYGDFKCKKYVMNKKKACI